MWGELERSTCGVGLPGGRPCKPVMSYGGVFSSARISRSCDALMTVGKAPQDDGMIDEKECCVCLMNSWKLESRSEPGGSLQL